MLDQISCLLPQDASVSLTFCIFLSSFFLYTHHICFALINDTHASFIFQQSKHRTECLTETLSPRTKHICHRFYSRKSIWAFHLCHWKKVDALMFFKVFVNKLLLATNGTTVTVWRHLGKRWRSRDWMNSRGCSCRNFKNLQSSKTKSLQSWTWAARP